MKKNRAIIIIFIILLIVSVLLVVKRSATTLKREISDFTVEDTSSVKKILMADKKNRSILLVKQAEGNWKLNGKYTASKEAVNSLLKTIYNMTVSRPVSDAARNNVISRMSVLATKVEIYQMVYRINLFDYIKLFPHEKLTKTFYVGDDTQQNTGTYMLMDGSENPFVVYIPSFRGFLSTRFMPIEDIWRDQSIFKLKIKEIKSVRLDFPATPDSSFVLSQTGNFTYSIIRPSDNASIDFDTLKVLSYLSAFQDVRYEALLNNILDKHKIDSITSSNPWYILTVTDTYGKAIKMKMFHKKPQNGDFYDEAIKKSIIFDQERLYALINDDKDFVLIQFYVFDKILKSVNNFKRN